MACAVQSRSSFMPTVSESNLTSQVPATMLEHFHALKTEINASSDPQHKLELSHNLYLLAQDLSESEAAEAALMLGANLHDCDQFEAALEALEEAQTLQRKIGNPDDLARVLDTIGNVKHSQGHYLQAMTFFRDALERVRVTNNILIQARVLNSISRVYNGLGDINNSLEYQLKSLEAARRCGSLRLEVDALSNLGVDYAALGAYEKALEFSHQAFVIAEQLGIESLKAMVLQGIGTHYLALHDDRAMECLKRACQMSHRSKDSRVMIEALHELGRTLMQQGRSDLTRRAFRWAIKLAAHGQRLHCEAEITYCLARLLLEYPQHETDAQEALELLQECLPKVETVGNVPLIAKTYRRLSEALEKAGQQAQAYEALKSSLLWFERHGNAEKQQRSLVLTMQHALSEGGRQAELERTQRIELSRVNQALMLQTERLERDATHDGLTGLPNRRYLERLLDSECEQVKTLEAPLCVALADIDDFKQVNDRFSHAIGDEVLRVIARIFRTQLREHDTVGRYGGEEFAFILPNTTKVTAATVLERLRLEIERFDWASVHATLSVTISIGIAEADQQQGRVALLNIADTNLYIAKRAGRNRTMG
jgi:diguanylate cyclase (GGDEF)-like protein